jgi:hypothetical protein
MRRLLFALAGGLALLAGNSVLAGPRVEADPNKMYAITPEVGPWVICAASYMGEDARELARQTVFQLRRRDNLPAYFFDYSEEERRQMQNYLQGRRGHVRIQNQCGVLVGGYPDEESARKALAEVKRLKIPELDLGPNKVVYDMTIGPDGRRLAINPFSNAFVTRNPTVRHGQAAEDKDPFLKQLNSGESFSLLKNPHSYTLAIRSYYGASRYNSTSASSSFLDSLWNTKKSADLLGACGAQAHSTAEALKSLGLGPDVWVLHTRRESIVTLGGFDSPQDPKIQESLDRLEAWRKKIIAANKSDPFQIALYPLLMRVPKE